MRTMVDLCQDWLYLPKNLGAAKAAACDERAFERVCLPHTNIELPWHNFDDRAYQFVSWYRRHLAAPARWKGKRLLLTFEGVMQAATVWVNGRKMGDHLGGYTPFTFDITDAVALGSDNVIAVRVDSRERKDIPPFGNIVDYLAFGGIYREVRLEVVEPVYIADVFARSAKTRLETTVTLQSAHAAAREVTVSMKIAGKSVKETVIVAPGERKEVALSLRGLKVHPWSLENPKLYDLAMTLDNGDAVTERIGFREARFAQDGRFLLNGKHIKLRGLDRHQAWAYAGGAMPARLQRRDADILRFELGLNIVRTSHYPQSRHFLDRCDEIGLLVFEEIPGWQHIGDEDWKAVSKQHVREMILRDRNRPSIILWGVRINESFDDHDFYAETNRIAHELDPTRQTGGVRNFQGSEFLEDVFTFNDFSMGVMAPNHSPYLITEFGGHMFPTKPFDNEERLMDHALLHARVQNAQHGRKDIAGALGWCAFDYNTHRQFGSGDRMCYHGVMDIFRFPKFAAHFYRSQVDPAEAVVLEPASHVKAGERNSVEIDPLVVFSNCDTVEIWNGPKRLGVFEPDREQFPHLPHPPFVCRGLHGFNFEADWAFVGKIKGKEVARRKMATDGVPHTLRLFADDKALCADGSDCTRVGFAATDRYGNILPYATGVVSLTLDGPGRLIGENPFALVAGRGALYLRAGTKKGVTTITAALPGLKPQCIKVRIR